MMRAFIKRIILSVFVFSLITLCGCVKGPSLDDCKSSLKNAAEGFKLELYEDEQRNLKYSVFPNEGGLIEITLFNDDSENANTVSSFKVEYTKKSAEDDFNVKLFVALVNSISRKSITEGYCNEFINAPEDRFPSSRYNHVKQEDELIAKWQALNFFEDWMITITTFSDGHEMLSFGGLT